MSFYLHEHEALLRLVKVLNVHSPFDVMRLALWEATNFKIRKERDKGGFNKPRFASARTMKSRKAA